MTIKKHKKIKIIHIINLIFPSTISLEVAQEINKKKFKNYLISFYKSNQKDKVNLHSFKKTIQLNAKSKFSPIKFFQLYKQIKKIKPDIIHTHHNLSGSLARIFGKLNNIPIIIDTEHSNYKSQNILSRLFNLLTLNLSDTIICNSRQTQKSLNKVFINKNKKKIIYNGVNIQKIKKTKRNKKLEKKFGINDDNFLIGNVANLRKIKNQEILIKALSKLPNHTSMTKLIIIGKGKRYQKLKKIALQYNVSNNIIFTDILPRKRVYQLLKRMDIFIMSSFMEGFCNALVEAMVAGLPILVSDIPVFKEILGNTGEYFNPNNPEELADKIIRLKNNPKKRKKLSEKVQKRAINKFPLKKTVKKYEKIYIELFNTKNK